jgi:hypothetical protein
MSYDVGSENKFNNTGQLKYWASGETVLVAPFTKRPLLPIPLP